MSETPNDDSGEQPQGGQPQGGQPPGGQGGQPRGRQPQSGQAQGGQAGGQAQQGQTQGQPTQGQAPQGQQQRAPVNTGPSVGDIFSRPDTLDQIKLGVVLYAVVGFGLGLGLFGVGSALSSQSSQLSSAFGAAFAITGSVAIPTAVSSVLAFLLGREIDDELADVDQTLVFATAGVTALAGSIVAYLISWILLGLGAGSTSLGNLALPIILTGIGSAVIAAGTIWAENNLLGPSGVPPQQGRQQY